MARLKVAIAYGSKPNYNNYALEYFILSLNKIQSTYEYCFPDLQEVDYPFSEKVCKYDESVKVLKEFIRETEFAAHYWVAIITQAFDGKSFLMRKTLASQL